MKRFILLITATLFFAFQIAVGSSAALDLSKELRTVPSNEAGKMVEMSNEEIVKGLRLFNAKCSQCHKGGYTKTDPNVSLGAEDLELATPPRDNLDGIIDYLNNPTTYDGEIEIAEFHPSTKSADVFPYMRNVSQDDLRNMAGYILYEINQRPDTWGCGKVCN
ncbi:MAG: cytochrome c-550 [Moorea sp. SIO4G2]|uniref:photosystem II cytochrome c-550 n=1 Tax=unclassified Moorena TaxID=2683338 RepID=UPI0013F9C838|nr:MULTISPECIES: photosystem II cytochrome c-550 [unclassified Moorena]NEO13138.1 cytochrome c-550 [Moorena sp. SIO3E8]NEO63836.1 cytochrome c-550 [Moorena sp. SIO4G2]NEP98156.1 cytochrome c-550 [Moorena sp. SIO3F7]